MANATGDTYNNAKKLLQQGDIDLINDTIKVAILKDTYTFDKDNDVYWSDVSGDEITDSNSVYTSGGVSLSNKSVTTDNANDLAYFDADDITLTNTAISSAKYLVVYKDTGTSTTSPLIACWTMDSTVTTSNEDFKIQWGSGGVCKIS